MLSLLQILSFTDALFSVNAAVRYSRERCKTVRYWPGQETLILWVVDASVYSTAVICGFLWLWINCIVSTASMYDLNLEQLRCQYYFDVQSRFRAVAAKEVSFLPFGFSVNLSNNC